MFTAVISLKYRGSLSLECLDTTWHSTSACFFTSITFKNLVKLGYIYEIEDKQNRLNENPGTGIQDGHPEKVPNQHF